jgi:hypothetical protein
MILVAASFMGTFPTTVTNADLSLLKQPAIDFSPALLSS